MIASLANIVCMRWDFKCYSGSYLYDPSIEYAYLASNKLTWHDINMEPIEIKSLKGTLTTHLIDFSGSMPYTLCQDVQLIAGRKYEVQYSLL